MESLQVRLPQETIDEIDKRAGDVMSRSQWIRIALEDQLEEPPVQDQLDELRERIDEVEYRQEHGRDRRSVLDTLFG